MSLANFRNEYDKFDLLRDQLSQHPKILFDRWVEEAIRLKAPEPTAMSLSTVSPSGMPSSRIVLLKGFDNQGVQLYTNYNSQKGQHLAHNPQACLLFFWPSLQRQIRLEGNVSKMDAQDSADYFNSRPITSRISAIASPQSQPIQRADLEQRCKELAEHYGNNPPCPEYWGGYFLKPQRIEFWQGRVNRLHDRYLYEQQKQDSTWKIQRLAP